MTMTDDSHPTPEQRPADSAGAPCSADELDHFAARSDALRQLRSAQRAIFRVVAALTAAGAALLVYGALNSQPLACDECQAHFAAFHAHQTGGQSIEDPALVERMAAHLAQCDPCRRKFAAAYPAVTAGRSAADRRETSVAPRGRQTGTAVPHATLRFPPARAPRAAGRLA